MSVGVEFEPFREEGQFKMMTPKWIEGLPEGGPIDVGEID